MRWFQFSILTQNIVPWLSNFDSSFALLTSYVFGDQVLKVVDETGGVSNNFSHPSLRPYSLVWPSLDHQEYYIWEAFSTSLPLHIYHWRRLDTFDTFDTFDSRECISTTTSSVKQLTRNAHSNHLNLFYSVCLLLIWQYRNVYSIRHCSSFFFFGRENFSESPETRPCSLETSEANRANTQWGNNLFEVVLDLSQDLCLYFKSWFEWKRIEKIRLSSGTINEFCFCEFYISSDCFDEINNTKNKETIFDSNSYQLNSFFCSSIRSSSLSLVKS